MAKPVHFPRYAVLTCFSFALLLLLGLSRFGRKTQYDPNRLFSVEEMVADVRYYQAQLDQKHPNAYLYTPKKDLDTFFDSLAQAIRKPMTETAFFDLLSLANSRIRDGHTHIFPSEASMNYHEANSTFIPLKIQWVDHKMYAIHVYADNAPIQDGTEIVSINGRSADEIRNHLMDRQIRDGYNTTYPMWILNNWFSGYYAFHFGHPEAFVVQYRTGNNGIDSVRLSALNKNNIEVYRQKKYGEKMPQDVKGEGITLQVDPATKTAVLSIRDFHNDILRKKYGQNFRSAVSACFQTLENQPVEHLILDLRNNQGGDIQNGSFLLSYLIDRPFQTVESYAVVTKNKGNEKDRTRQTTGPSMGIHQPNKNCFKGKLYVLTNGGSFSNSGIVCSALQFYTECIFVGEETGGNAHLICGDGKYSRLPNTGLKILIPTLQFQIRNIAANTGHGTIPDYPVQPGVADLLAKNDTVLHFTYALIRSAQHK